MATCAGLSMLCATMAPRLAEPVGMDSANTASRMVGSDQRGDGDLAAGAHPAERGAGVDAGQGQRDGAQKQQTDDGEQIGDRVQR